MRRALITAALAALCWTLPPAGRPRAAAPELDLEGSLETVRKHIAALRLEQADALLVRLAKAHPDSPEVIFRRGVLDFYGGDYESALSRIDTALSGVEPRAAWESMRALVRDTHRVVSGYVEVASPDGRYVVHHAPGDDTVMAAHALEVLEAADTALQDALGLRLPGPVRLEIYPTASALASVSSLTVEQIETTGTIALSKWDRLMITSPRALVRGYPWADTITHEFTHMVVSRLTGEQAPVWLQEGLAKLLEQSWRTRKPGARLEPASIELLHQAAREDALLSFDDMHPSIAMLPSQEAAALAFAEVATFIDDYAARHGMETLRGALARLDDDRDAREALAEAAGVPFAKLEKTWKGALRTAARQGKRSQGARHIGRRLKGTGGRGDDSLDVQQSDARRFLRLGDLLWDRNRIAAAAIEYGKAHAADGDDPIVATRFARAALETGDPARARDAMATMAERYPDEASVHAMLGAARLSLGDRPGAERALLDAVLVNPFDPQPQCDLARSSDEARIRDRAQTACSLLRKAR